MTERTSFVYYTDWARELLNYPDDLRLKIDDAVKRYVLYGEEPTDREVIYSMFGLMRTQLDRDNDKWNSTKQKRSDAGKKGMATRWADNKNNKCYHSITNITDNVDVNVNGNEDVNVSSFLEDSSKKITFDFVSAAFSELFEMWLKYKRERGDQYTPAQAKAFYSRLTQLSNGDPATARKIVEQAMVGNYPSIVQLANTHDNADYHANHRPTPAENIRAAQEAHLMEIAAFINNSKQPTPTEEDEILPSNLPF